MKTTFLAAALFAVTSLPYPPTFAQTAASPESAPQSQPSQATESQSQPSAAANAAVETQPIELRSVSGELMSNLDTKTAKPGDNVVIQTHDAIKTPDGTEIPRGSKLTGHVIAVQPSSGGTNSQVAVNIDHAEINGGQSLPIHSEIQSVGSAESASTAASRDTSAMSRSSAASSMPSSGAQSADSGSNNAAGSAPSPGYAPGYTPGTTGQSSAAPTAGTIVARNGHIAIRTTSMPGILLANNAPGEMDPRMTQASGILLGAKKDVKLDSGTKVVVGVSSSSAAAASEPQSTQPSAPQSSNPQ